jgi:PIN domain nuclease of toxin-antitoxin system
MKLLLDSCTFLRLIWNEPDLPASAREQIRAPENELFLSAASLWEMLIKHGAGKLEVRAPGPAHRHFARMREAHRIEALPVTEAELAHLAALPPLHRDPFDRILICQAIEHGLTILTPDPAIRRYPVKTLW